MDTKIILETSPRTLAGTTSFPEVVKNLLSTGVEYCHVDYVMRPSQTILIRKHSRRTFSTARRTARSFDFSIRAVKSGVQGYFAFLRGRRVTYFGRSGDQHTEWFPEAKPAAPS